MARVEQSRVGLGREVVGVRDPTQRTTHPAHYFRNSVEAPTILLNWFHLFQIRP